MTDDIFGGDQARELRLAGALVEAEHQAVELGLLLKDVVAARGLPFDGRTFALTHLVKNCWQNEVDPYLLLDAMLANGAVDRIAAAVDQYVSVEELVRP